MWVTCIQSTYKWSPLFLTQWNFETAWKYYVTFGGKPGTEFQTLHFVVTVVIAHIFRMDLLGFEVGFCGQNGKQLEIYVTL